MDVRESSLRTTACRLQMSGAMNAMSVLACIHHGPTNDLLANPYLLELTVALVILTGVFVHWRRVRPRPSAVLRFYLGLGSVTVCMIMLDQALFYVEPSARNERYLFGLKTSLFLSAALLLEIALSPRPAVVARATALKRGRRGVRLRSRS